MIKINDVVKKYGDTVILNHASYTFPQNGIVCLMGASGGGKTTLLNLIAGFDSAYNGDITIGQTNISKLNADDLCRYRKDNIGFVFQNYHLISGYTVLDNILLASELTGEKPDESVDKARRLLGKLGISEKEKELTENLSGGQKQRVAIARALMGNPQIILADEPTGALDRTTSNEIMQLLKEISAERLVVVITHDPKICDYADEIIHISNMKIISEKIIESDIVDEKPLILIKSGKSNPLNRAMKNFKVHLKRYAAVSVAISIGMLAFLFSLSFGNVMEQSIEDFKAKNTAFNNGYIKGVDDGTTFDLLKQDERIENVYMQYKLENITLNYKGKLEVMAEKFPTAKAAEGLSYGVMPRNGKNEIAITPSLAKKFIADIDKLIGNYITVEYQGETVSLLISGIYNAGYDDFFVSSDVEQKWYKDKADQDNYSISYDVKDFNDIVTVSNELSSQKIDSSNASKEVGTLQNTFNTLSKLFMVISILILAIGLFISIILLAKLQNTRYREIGLLSALGFNKQRITSIIIAENLLLSTLATVVNLALLCISFVVSMIFGFALSISVAQVLISIVATFIVVMLVSGVVSLRLIRTEPAVALRK